MSDFPKHRICIPCLSAWFLCKRRQFLKADSRITSYNVCYTKLLRAGFFEKYTDKTDKEVIKILHKKRINDYTQLYKSYYDPGMSLSAIELASLDEDKMLYLDLEADVCNENKIYCEVIKMFDKLGKEDFNPTQISEFWESETGPIHVSFIVDSDTIKINPDFKDDWLHECVFIECQKQIERKGNYRLVYSLGVV